MDWNVKTERLLGQKKELASYRDDLLSVKRKIMRHKENVNLNWHSEEIREVNHVIDDITYRLQKTCNHIEEVETKMSKLIVLQEEE